MGCGAATANGSAYRELQTQNEDSDKEASGKSAGTVPRKVLGHSRTGPDGSPFKASSSRSAGVIKESGSKLSLPEPLSDRHSYRSRTATSDGFPYKASSGRSAGLSGGTDDDTSVRRSGSAHAESFFLERSSSTRSNRSPGSTRGLLSFSPLEMDHKPSIDYRTLLPERFEIDVSRRYALDKLALGEGGFGKVYVAKDTRFADRLVAVKLVVKVGNADIAKCFYSEIKLMKELDHPNICKLLETLEKDNMIFVVMEYCEGGEVFERIISLGHISERITSVIISQVSSALRYAHGKKIAHRDMKPENIVFCSRDPQDNSVKVIDWGLGVSFADGDGMRAVVGSTTYAAPEILVHRVGDGGKKYTAACDLWSLGVVTYVMLCGKPPFWGSLRQQLARSMAERYPMSRPPWDTMSEEAKDFVKRLLRANPDNRMSIEAATAHPWLVAASGSEVHNKHNLAEVLQNLRRFSNRSVFQAMCVTSVARQLDHKHLKGIHQFFREIDTNGDGVLSFEEVSEGFRKIFGEDSQEYREVGETFAQLDLDGSGTIDYTEFCAAGLGKHAADQEEAIWAAFKTFDIQDTGSITKGDLEKVLTSASVRNKWTEEVCTEVVQGVMERFDADGNGTIEYEEWMQFMRTVWEDHNMMEEEVPVVPIQQPEGMDRIASGKSTMSYRSTRSAWSTSGRASVKHAYDFLRHVNRLEDIPDGIEEGHDEAGPSAS